MLLLLMILVPAAASLLLFRDWAPRTPVLVGTAGLHLAATLLAWRVTPAADPRGWIALDPLGLIALTTISALFFVVAFYTVGFLQREPRGGRVFTACLLAFLAAATLVAVARHMALLWIGMEATTLALAPLVYQRHDRRSLEAVWKYLVLSSVGIGLALLGTFFLASAQVQGRPLVLEDLIRHADTLQPGLLRAGFIFLLVGYGTKMGLAPLHSWKPDTYGEAPSHVAGLMAGALTTCAFLGLARVTQVAVAAHQLGFIQAPLIALGLASLVVSAAFMIGQTDLKRLLAYSSVEHMGILVIGLGLGGAGSYGTVLHLLNNGLIKGLVFLVVGNVALAYQTSQAGAIRGVLQRMPISGTLLLVGLFAVTGSPPFGLFVSEFAILGAAVQGGKVWLAVVMVALLALIFVGMARLLLDIIYGAPPSEPERTPEPMLMVAGPVALALIGLFLGLYIPGPLQAVLISAAGGLGGAAP
jgi:hydrogenase-4 component F